MKLQRFIEEISEQVITNECNITFLLEQVFLCGMDTPSY